jgi:hypothetical protein
LGAKYGCDHIAIYSDNTNAIDRFSSLYVKPIYNPILIATVDLAINKSLSTKVYYIPGRQNVITNYLSRFQNAKALHLAQNMCIQLFQPPWNALGVVKNDQYHKHVQAAHSAALDCESLII